MNRDQADALARFLHLCRPEWQHAGILKALGDAKAGDPLNVGLAAIRWTANPAMRTPGGMGRPGDHWNERVITGAPRPLKPSEVCRNCGLAKHAPYAECDGRPPMRTADVSAPVAHLRALRDEATTELCGHGVARTNCTDKHAETEPTEGETDGE